MSKLEKSSQSALEEDLLYLIKKYKLPIPVQQFQCTEFRNWRSDFCWIEYNLIVEIEGGLMLRGKKGQPIPGKHNSKKGFENDCVKYNTLVLKGFTLIRVCKIHLYDGYPPTAIKWIEKAIENHKKSVDKDMK